jgi:hypothetical protein
MEGKSFFEGIGGTLNQDLEAFLKYRFGEMIEHNNLKKYLRHPFPRSSQHQDRTVVPLAGHYSMYSYESA